MPLEMQFVTPASALEAVLRLRGFTVTPNGKDIDVSLPRTRTLTVNPRSRIASSGKHNHRTLKGTTPNEMADELTELLQAAR